jgi:hypothetical protein
VEGCRDTTRLWFWGLQQGPKTTDNTAPVWVSHIAEGDDGDTMAMWLEQGRVHVKETVGCCCWCRVLRHLSPWPQWVRARFFLHSRPALIALWTTACELEAIPPQHYTRTSQTPKHAHQTTIHTSLQFDGAPLKGCELPFDLLGQAFLLMYTPSARHGLRLRRCFLKGPAHFDDFCLLSHHSGRHSAGL